MPSYVGGIPVYMCGGKMKYGFGSWLKSNAGNILQTAGGIGAMFVPGGQAAGIGMIASGVSGLATTGDAIGNQEKQAIQQQQELNNQQLLNSLPTQQQYNFANGGLLTSYNVGGDITDRTTSFDTGGLHSENGGIPIGQNALVERDEFMYTTKDGKKYIFSNKLMR